MTLFNNYYLNCDSNVSLKFCPDRVAFPLSDADFCRDVSKNSLILVLLIFLLNSLYTAAIDLSAYSEPSTVLCITV